MLVLRLYDVRTKTNRNYFDILIKSKSQKVYIYNLGGRFRYRKEKQYLLKFNNSTNLVRSKNITFYFSITLFLYLRLCFLSWTVVQTKLNINTQIKPRIFHLYVYYISHIFFNNFLYSFFGVLIKFIFTKSETA